MTSDEHLRIAVLWPKPRAARWQLGQTMPEEYPDFSDGLLYLRHEGVDVAIEESLGGLLNPLSRMHEFYSGLDPLRAVRVAWRRRQYDAAICVGDATAYFLLRVREALGARLPIVLIDPALSDTYPRRKRLQDFVIPRVEHVVVFGQAQLAYLRREYGELPVSVLHHRADTDFYCPGEPPRPTGEGPYVFSIGNDQSRDFATLAAAAQICARKPAFSHRFVVQTTRDVPAGVPRLEVYRERISYTRLRDRYRGAAVVVIPVHDVVHPGGINSVLEAMAAGCPLVVSRSSGLDDYLRDGETALVVPPGDAPALAAAVQRLIDEPKLAVRLGAAARPFVVGHCQNRVYAHALAKILRGVARLPCSPPRPSRS